MLRFGPHASPIRAGCGTTSAVMGAQRRCCRRGLLLLRAGLVTGLCLYIYYQALLSFCTDKNKHLSSLIYSQRLLSTISTFVTLRVHSPPTFCDFSLHRRVGIIMSSALSLQIASALLQWMFNTPTPSQSDTNRTTKTQLKQNLPTQPSRSSRTVPSPSQPSTSARPDSSTHRSSKSNRSRSPETTPLLGTQSLNSARRTQEKWEKGQEKGPRGCQKVNGRPGVVWPMLGSL